MATLTTSSQGSRTRMRPAPPRALRSGEHLARSPAVGAHKFARAASKGEMQRRAVQHDKTAQIKDGCSAAQTKRIDLRTNKPE